jgi:flavin reductase (DIM6/NTAB) family NADH-FMN oxidoreductase RutF
VVALGSPRRLPDPDLCCGADEFRGLMSHWPTGVTVITSWDGDNPVGCTVNAMMSVSLNPPLLMVALGAGSKTLRAIRGTGVLGLNVLSADQRDLCQRFACGSQHERFHHVRFGDQHDVPLLAGTAAAAVCVVRDTSPCGDHVLILAEPVWHTEREDGSPLVFHRSCYRQLGGRPAATDGR